MINMLPFDIRQLILDAAGDIDIDLTERQVTSLAWRIAERATRPPATTPTLTRREYTALLALVSGERPAETAQRLHVAESTVKKSRRDLYRTLGASPNAVGQAVVIAIGMGLIRVPGPAQPGQTGGAS